MTIKLLTINPFVESVLRNMEAKEQQYDTWTLNDEAVINHRGMLAALKRHEYIEEIIA
jgi:hypothetical protein